MMVNAQREYLRDKSKASTPQSDFEGMGSAVLPYQVFEPSSSEGIRSYTVAQKKVVHSYETTDFEETREIIAQRLIRHEKAAPQRKRRLKW